MEGVGKHSVLVTRCDSRVLKFPPRHLSTDVHTGRSTIPLMNHPDGPLFFWLICLVLTAFFLAYIRYSRRWI